VATTRNTARPAVWIVPVIVLTVLTVVLVILAGSSRGDDAQTNAAATTAAADSADSAAQGPVDPDSNPLLAAARRDPNDPLTTGSVDAPVVLTTYTDYQCSHCVAWAHETLPELQPYVDSGVLRIEWRDTNFFGEASVITARAAYAAALQGKFWEYHDAVVADGPIGTSADVPALIALAGDLGLDVDQFTADMDSDDVAAAVDTNSSDAIAIGVTSIPSFVINGTPIVGAQPTEVFVQTIESAAEQG
jgi:protein-disulfide isomerase